MRRAYLVSILVPVAALSCGPAWTSPLPQLLTPNWAQLAAYRKVKSYVDRSTVNLVASVPDLRDLDPAADRQQGKKVLRTTLERMGKNVRQFYAKFPGTTPREHITMEIPAPDGDVHLRRDQTFRYLAVAPTGHGVSGLLEYRTNRDGKPVKPGGRTQGFVLTRGCAYSAIYFHPAFRSDCFFRDLGKQKLNGKGTDVNLFAQKPAWASLPIQVNTGENCQLAGPGLGMG